MKAEPQKEHQWLQKLVGEWAYEHDGVAGKESARSIGGLWVVAEGQGEMPGGGAATTLLTLGYDPEKKRYVGTWIGSMMTHLWVYDGALDESGKVLTLETEGPAMAGASRTAKYKDVIEFQSDDHRVLTSHMLGDDGKWSQIMRADYRRNSIEAPGAPSHGASKQP